MRWNRWIRVALQTMLAVVPAVAPLTFDEPASAADDPEALNRLLKTLQSPANAITSAERDEAALELLNRDTPEAQNDIRSILKDAGNVPAQTSLARAISQQSSPDPALIDSLGKLLGSNRLLTEAAAAALANYRGTSGGYELLKRFIDNSTNPSLSRVGAIRAIGSQIDPEPGSAQYLLDLASQPNQIGTIKDAAIDALADLSGINNNGKDLGKWKQWVTAQAGKTPDQFKATLLQNRLAQFNQLKQRNAQLTASVKLQLETDYTALPVNARNAVLLSYLNDRAPDIRYVGVDLVSQTWDSQTWKNNPPQPAVRTRLFELIGDSDDKVRAIAVNLMLTFNDPGAVKPLMAQLAIEKDAKVKQLIAQTLGKLGDPAAVPPLLALLQAPQNDDVIAAAKAFTNFGESLRQNNPGLASDVAAQLRKILKANLNQPGADELRAACMNALAALKDPKSFDTFMDCFRKPGENADVRKAALIGFANLGNTDADQIVADQLSDADPSIRLEAARALQTVATPADDEQIYQHMNSDTDPKVQNALWETMQKLYEKEPADQIKHWATRFEKDPEKKLVTLLKLGEALKRGKDQQGAVLNEQEIAAAMLAVKPPQINEAIVHLQNALDYWRGPGKETGGSEDRLQGLVEQMLNDKLLAQQWSDATAFAADQIALSPAYGRTVGYRIREKIDELIKENKTADAQKLIDAALAMKPPLDQKYVSQIQQDQADLKQK